MYEARQNKKKVNRRIDPKQRVEMKNGMENTIMIPNVTQMIRPLFIRNISNPIYHNIIDDDRIAVNRIRIILKRIKENVDNKITNLNNKKWNKLSDAKKSEIQFDIKYNILNPLHRYILDFSDLIKINNIDNGLFTIDKTKIKLRTIEKISDFISDCLLQLINKNELNMTESAVNEYNKASFAKKIYLGSMSDIGSYRKNLSENKIKRVDNSRLNAKIWTWGVNQAFMQGGVDNRKDFKLVTLIPDSLQNFLTKGSSGNIFIDKVQYYKGNNSEKFYHKNYERPTWYSYELAYLLNNNYHFVKKEPKEIHKMIPND